jgi:hypothetical protein
VTGTQRLTGGKRILTHLHHAELADQLRAAARTTRHSPNNRRAPTQPP